MRTGRIDYRMQRRATLRDVEAGLRSVADVCDAHEMLVRAGGNIGTPSDDACPVCDETAVRHVTYVFTGRAAKGKGEGGRAVPRERLATEVERHGDLKVFTVEVCLACRWHHLLESFFLLRTGAAAG
jgi:hypothetical protein